MGSRTIRKDFSKTIEIGEGDRLVIKEGVVGRVETFGIAEPSTAETPEGMDNARIRVDGKIIVSGEGALNAAIFSACDVDDVVITVGKTGVLRGGLYGIHHGGPGLVVENAGLIRANIGIGGQMAAPDITNSGRIIGVAAGIDWSTSLGGELVNSGLIRASEGPAINVPNFLTAETFSITNSGTIETMAEGGYAISVEAITESVRLVNTGTITGNVLLGYGSSEFINRGTVNGTVTGSSEDSVFRLFARAKLDDYGGEDIVYSTVSVKLPNAIEELVLRGKKDINGTGDYAYNTITGNSGDNILKGLFGDDTLAGGKGDDRLFGGEYADTFVYSTGFDRDVIEDAEAADWIDLRGVDVAVSLDALLALSGEKKGNVVLDFGSGDTLTFRDMTLEEFAELQFMFHGAPG